MNSAAQITSGLDVLETKSPNPREQSEIALANLGLEVERGPDVGAILRVLAGLSTAGGHARQTRLEHCGVAYPVLTEDDQVVWARRGCRDRFCPDCGDRLGRRLAQAVARRAAGCLQVLSIALTRPKVSCRCTPRCRPGAPAEGCIEETPGQALAAMSRACTKLMQSPLMRSRGKTSPPPALPGGVRFLEVTAREAGQKIGDHVVETRGIHAHAHIIAQLRPDWTLERATAALLETWQSIVGGASAGAQRVTMLAAADIARAAAYAASFGALARLVDIAPNYARAVAAAMAGRVLAKAWGSWRGCLKPAKSGARFGDRSIASILKAPGGIVRFGAQAWQASDLYRVLLQRPQKMGEET